MKEVFLNKDDSYKFNLLLSGFVISFFYDKELFAPGDMILLIVYLDTGNNIMSGQTCKCVSHNNNILVLV